MKIFITGCRKSGTNLLLRMFWAFSDVHVFPMETSLNKLIAEVPPLETSILVAKMCEYHLMGVLCPGKQPDRQLQAALAHDVKLVNVIRDGREVVCSEGGRVRPVWWVQAVRQSILFKEYLSCQVRFEQLIRNPDETQKIIVDSLGLKPLHKFSEYPDFVPKIMEDVWRSEESQVIKKGYENRRLDSSRIGYGRKKFQKRCSADELGKMRKLLITLGYMKGEK